MLKYRHFWRSEYKCVSTELILSDILSSTVCRDSWRSFTERFKCSFSGQRIATASLRHFLTNSPSRDVFFAQAIFHASWCYTNVTVSECLVNFRKSWLCFSDWRFKVFTLCLWSSLPLWNSRATVGWSDVKWHSRFEALKCDNVVWHIKQNGFPFRSTKKYKFFHSDRNALCSSSYLH